MGQAERAAAVGGVDTTSDAGDVMQQQNTLERDAFQQQNLLQR